MKKATSAKGSRGGGSIKSTAPVVVSPSSVQKENDTIAAAEEETEFMQNDENEMGYDEEEGLIPALTPSAENIDAVSILDNETYRTVDTTEAAMTKIVGSAHEGTGTSISSQIQKIIAIELTTPAKKGKIDLQSVPLKEYLEQTVLPIVHQGLLALSRERPVAPIEYLAAYFLKHKHKYQNDRDQQTMYGMDQEKSSRTSESPGQNQGTPPGNVPPSTVTSTRESSGSGPTTPQI